METARTVTWYSQTADMLVITIAVAITVKSEWSVSLKFYCEKRCRNKNRRIDIKKMIDLREMRDVMAANNRNAGVVQRAISHLITQSEFFKRFISIVFSFVVSVETIRFGKVQRVGEIMSIEVNQRIVASKTRNYWPINVASSKWIIDCEMGVFQLIDSRIVLRLLDNVGWAIACNVVLR